MVARAGLVEVADHLVAHTEHLDGVGIKQRAFDQLDHVVNAGCRPAVGDAGDQGEVRPATVCAVVLRGLRGLWSRRLTLGPFRRW